ncbi:NAD-dependent epimerase/dehydratase family protein [Pelagibacteraceae bacterium]|nr:NAD-dependent epimerase/dehydratase family protein [Pelagibacteraceae bacterium]
MKIKTIAILGSSGFIGTNLLLNFSKKKNYKVFAYFNKKKPIKIKNVKYIKCNFLNFSETKKKINKNFDIIIQAAAQTSGVNDIVNNPQIHVTNNVKINSNILDACQKLKIKKFIFFSCTTMYQTSKKPIKEKDFNANIDLEKKYFGVGHTKLFIEKMCEFFSRITKCKFTAIRHSNIYGPYDKFDLKKSHVFGATISKVLNSKKEIMVWGRGSEKRDLLYIDDLISFVEKVIQKQKKSFAIYNCGYGKAISISNLVKKIIIYSKKNLKVRYDLTKPSINTSFAIDTKCAEREIKWKKKISLNKGIELTYNWANKNMNI